MRHGTCTCWECRKAGGPTAVAPLIARAYQLERAMRPLVVKARRDLLQAERLLAHRELQLVRAGSTRKATRDGRYMNGRVKKLQDARIFVARAREKYEALV